MNSSNAKSASVGDRSQVRWISPKPANDGKVLKIQQHARPVFRAVIVDRDSMSRDLVAHALVKECGCEAAVVEPAELLSVLGSSAVDLVVIGADVTFLSGNGFDLAHAVACAHAGTFIVMLLNQPTHEPVINAFRAGARGVVSRQQPLAEFLDCVEHVRKGYIWAGRQETDVLLVALRNIPSPNLVTATDSPTLTPRELQVVQCAAAGKTNKVIANQLNLSEHTVKNYLFRAFEKLGVSSRVELLFYLTVRGHTFAPAKAESAAEPYLSRSLADRDAFQSHRRRFDDVRESSVLS